MFDEVLKTLFARQDHHLAHRDEVARMMKEASPYEMTELCTRYHVLDGKISELTEVVYEMRRIHYLAERRTP